MSGVVQFSRLGSFGRFGNQLFQYCFSRAFAESHDAVLEIPNNWVGRKIFKNINNPGISCKLKTVREDEIPNKTDVDLFGYYQSVDCLNYLRISKIKEWLNIKNEWLDSFKKPKDYYISCHIRKGDYLTKYSDVFCIIPETSYKDFCSKRGYKDEDIIFISEEKPGCHNVFRKEGFEFLYDFMVMMESNILIRSNSTFSFWAGVLGNSVVYSPNVKNKVGINDVDFVDNNWESVCDPKYHNNKRMYNLYIKD